MQISCFTDPDPETDRALWKSFCFCDDTDAWHGMKWDCKNKPSTSVNFMDLTISIDNGRSRIITPLYEKDLNLYLYIPPFSSHPCGVFTGTISGQIL
eukprot:scaffold148520_cov43-Cyclotella_meneghiniana.AAC.2